MILQTSKAIMKAKTLEESMKALSSPSSPEDIIEQKHEYLNGINAYALRCAILHNGDGEVGTQDIYDDKRFRNKTLGIKNVKFDSEISSRVLIQFEDTVHLNPKVFCNALLEGVEEWIGKKKDTSSILDNTKKLQIFA